MMSLRHCWDWQPPQTASHIHIRRIKCLSTFICCPWTYGSCLKQLYPHYLAQILGFSVTCGVKMMSLHHGWEFQPTQTSSCIQIWTIKSVRAHSYDVHWGKGSSLKQLYPHYLTRILRFWVTCGVKTILLCHGWGWQPTQTASRIHIRHIQKVWPHWYAAHGHEVAAIISYTHTTWLIIWGSGSLVKMMSCVMVLADSQHKLLPTSTSDMYKVLEHDMLSMGKWQ